MSPVLARKQKSHEGRGYHPLKKPPWLHCTFCKMMDGITPSIKKTGKALQVRLGLSVPYAVAGAISYSAFLDHRLYSGNESLSTKNPLLPDCSRKSLT